MFKIAYGAGHNDKTGNGIPKSLHTPFMNEWRLNDRVAKYFAEAAAQYKDVELLRVDDPAGLARVSLSGRCKTANNWKANFFLSIHHNAGINGGKGGGLVAFSNPGSTKGAVYRDAIYKACMASGGIKGDRWDATPEYGYYVLQYTNMPAVLMEYGFMDSVTDVPVILTEEYAKAMAYATMAGIAKVAKLKLKPEYDPAQQQFYRVQVGAFNVRANAEAMLQQLQEQSYEAFIVTVPVTDEAAPAEAEAEPAAVEAKAELAAVEAEAEPAAAESEADDSAPKKSTKKKVSETDTAEKEES